MGGEERIGMKKKKEQRQEQEEEERGDKAGEGKEIDSTA